MILSGILIHFQNQESTENAAHMLTLRIHLLIHFLLKALNNTGISKVQKGGGSQNA